MIIVPIEEKEYFPILTPTNVAAEKDFEHTEDGIIAWCIYQSNRSILIVFTEA